MFVHLRPDLVGWRSDTLPNARQSFWMHGGESGSSGPYVDPLHAS